MFGRRLGGKRKSSSGQAPVLAAILFLLLVPTTIIIAENATTNLTGSIVANFSFENATYLNITNMPGSENATLLENATDKLPAPENLTTNGTNASLEAGTLYIETPENETGDDDSLNITLPENETPSNTTSPENTTINISIPGNTSDTPFPENATNTTLPENQTQETPPSESPGPLLVVDLDVPEKVDRNVPFRVSAEVTNAGETEARNVELEWVLPEGVSISEGNEIQMCDVPSGGPCTSNLALIPSLSSSLGEKEIKVLVRYHD
jgi:hypothetical protein